MALSYPGEDQINLVINASPMPTAIFSGRSMVISLVNQAMLDVWGRDRSVIGKTLREAVPELEGQPFHALLDQVFVTGEPYHANEGRADLMVDGVLQTSYFTYSYNPIKDSDGKTTAIVNTAADITELVLARQKIAETEERLSFAMRASGVGTWDMDPLNHKVKWDARCRELHGYPYGDEITYEEFSNCLHPGDKETVDAAILAAITPGSDGQLDIRYRTNVILENEICWVHCKGTAYFNADGMAHRFAGTVQDITHEIKASRRVQQLMSIVENNSDNMTIADMEGNMIYMNQAARKMLGVGADEDVSKLSAADFYSAKELDLVQNHVVKKITEFNGWKGPLTLRNKNTKEEFFCQVNYVLIKDPETGEVIGRGASARDMRPELNARKLLSDRNAELQDAVKELEFLANSVPSVVWTSKPNGEWDYINQRWYERGVGAIRQTLGNGWTESLHPDDVGPAMAAWRVSVKTGKPYQAEFRAIDKNDDYRWWLVRALPLRDENDNIIKWYGSNTDITEHKEFLRQKDVFLGIAGHELKTPVTSIKAYSQVMHRVFLNAGDMENAAVVSRMDKQVERLSSLIGDLLDITKINSGRMQFNFERFDFNQMVVDVIDDMQRTASRHTIKRQLHFKREVVGDRHRIMQVIINLLTNAIKYSPDASEVFVYTEDEGEQVKLCVKDFGIGISEGEHEKVFAQFYRVSGSIESTFPGLGLGLFISSEIIKRLGGMIWVDSVEGKGSTFCFTIPVNRSRILN